MERDRGLSPWPWKILLPWEHIFWFGEARKWPQDIWTGHSSAGKPWTDPDNWMVLRRMPKIVCSSKNFNCSKCFSEVGWIEGSHSDFPSKDIGSFNVRGHLSCYTNHQIKVAHEHLCIKRSYLVSNVHTFVLVVYFWIRVKAVSE